MVLNANHKKFGPRYGGLYCVENDNPHCLNLIRIIFSSTFLTNRIQFPDGIIQSITQRDGGIHGMRHLIVNSIPWSQYNTVLIDGSTTMFVDRNIHPIDH